MKTLLILILMISLSAAAYYTRPSEADFQEYAKAQISDKPRGFWDKVFHKKPESQVFLEQCEFKDRYLWVVVEKDGQAIFTGAFDHWFAHGSPLPKVEWDDEDRSKDDSKSVVTQVE
jgi:hypothetical protein